MGSQFSDAAVVCRYLAVGRKTQKGRRAHKREYESVMCACLTLNVRYSVFNVS